ncbi:hypothetical protein OBA47_02065 [bacterium]|nr:hypothetical protein [bacterium]
MLFALGGVFALICVWIGSDLAEVLGIGTVGTLLEWSVASGPAGSMPFGPDIGQNSRFR